MNVVILKLIKYRTFVITNADVTPVSMGINSSLRQTRTADLYIISVAL
jgi:hypothetical protein